jgi:g-D-glutamyl-meso-diaminopimelate peptidase
MEMKISVRNGDTLWYYSQLFRLPLHLLIDSNRSVNPNALVIGQSLLIPGFVENEYSVKSGDTLYQIAQDYVLPIDALFLLNPGIDVTNMKIGSIIKIPKRVTVPVINGRQAYDYDVLIRDITKLVDIYPFLRKGTVGESVLAKPIPEIRIGYGAKRVHVNGSFHANEWITTPIIMTFLNDYLLSLTNGIPLRGVSMNPLYLQTMLSIVPMVNPDGVNLVLNGPPTNQLYNQLVTEINNGSEDFSDWKANIRGVDLNNQFPANWNIEAKKKPTEPSPRDYPGERPLTEPESLAMANLTKTRNFDRVLAIHTQGEVIYWGYEGLEPPIAEAIVEEFQRVSGYEPVQTVASYAGYKDWFIQEWKRPGYTVELGHGVNPLPLSQFNEIYKKSIGIFIASLYM